MTRIPVQGDSSVKQTLQSTNVTTEYSAREVSPPSLLLQQILRAHHVFLLHQAPSLAELWSKLPRQRFCNILKRFWDSFIWTWDVLLHGNPAVDIYHGLKLASGGELGFGADERDTGSGEREVLEGFVKRTQGLVDIVVSRFGDVAEPRVKTFLDCKRAGVGTGEYAEPADGVIFSGVGAISRKSARDISSWVEWLAIYGENAYGVRENPVSTSRRKRKPRFHVAKELPKKLQNAPDIPAPIVSHPRAPSMRKAETNSKNETNHKNERSQSDDFPTSTDTIIKYLTLGVYGSSWGIASGRPGVNQQDLNPTTKEILRSSGKDSEKSTDNGGESDLTTGHFLIGLLGDLETEEMTDEGSAEEGEADEDQKSASGNQSINNRILMRLLHVELQRPSSNDGGNDDANAHIDTFDARLRVVVYVQPPFVFTLLFEVETPALALPAFYRSLHHQLGPLQRPLQKQTSPDQARKRLEAAMVPRSTGPSSSSSTQPIRDLVYDPARMTIHTTIPNIPEPNTFGTSTPASGTAAAAKKPWTRTEAMTVHSQILNTYAMTRQLPSELERTCKTSRGWWVVWMRLPPSTTAADNTATTDTSLRVNNDREAFLIRKASDYSATTAARKATPNSGGRFRGLGVSGSRGLVGGGDSGGGGGGSGMSKLAEGIGIDARQYIESLLSMSR